MNEKSDDMLGVPAVTSSFAVAPGTIQSADPLDTIELRWFASGPAPPDVLRWFDEVGPVSMVEERSDLYRIGGLAAVSVKFRFGEILEMKVRRSVDRPLVIPEGPAGRPETWRKWSPADGLVGVHHDPRWVAVHKTIARKATHPTRSVGGEPDGLGPIGCDIEIAQVRVGPLRAWSLAFSAFGEGGRTRRRRVITDGWRALVEEEKPPPEMLDGLVVCAPYSSWLRAVVDPAVEGGGRRQSWG